MALETIFSLASMTAMLGWLALLASPLSPKWSERIAGTAIPVLLAAAYAVLLALFWSGGDGGYGSLAEVSRLFERPESVLAAWIHFLAFDLFVGAWACRTARRESIPFWPVVPCLALTFLFGPAGFLAFSGLRAFRRARAAG